MADLNAPNAPRTRLPALLLGIAGAVALLGVLLTHALLREYGDTNASGFVQGLKAAAVPVVMVLALAGVAFSLRKVRAVALMAVAVVLASVLGTAVAGQVAVSAKYASYPRTPDCSASAPTTSGKDGSFDPTTRAALARVQTAFDALQHPSPFVGTLETSSVEPNGASCLAGLATDDLGRTVGFYRAELAAQGWALREETPTRLVATKDGLALTVDLGDGATPQVRMTYLPR